LHEVDEAASIIKEAADAEANIIVGQVINQEMGDELVVTVIATGFEHGEDGAKIPVSSDRAATRPVRTGQQVLAAVSTGGNEKPVRDLDRPAFLRKLSEQRDLKERVGLLPDDEWDVPTFLRKQAD
ncbi:MAG: cell division protein FtsZ, partial [Nitrospiraceae bacterium]